MVTQSVKCIISGANKSNAQLMGHFKLAIHNFPHGLCIELSGYVCHWERTSKKTHIDGRRHQTTSPV